MTRTGPRHEIRRLEEADLPELVQLCREHAAYEEAAWRDGDRVPGLRDLLLSTSDARCWVVEGNGELAGFATVTMERSTWDAARFLHLDCLFLRPAYRGQGLGQALFARVVSAATELGAVNLQWQTPTWNEGAIRFYRRLGATSSEKLRFTMSPERCAALAAEADPPRFRNES